MYGLKRNTIIYMKSILEVQDNNLNIYSIGSAAEIHFVIDQLCGSVYLPADFDYKKELEDVLRTKYLQI